MHARYERIVLVLADKIRLHAVWTPSGGPYISAGSFYARESDVSGLSFV